MEGDSPKEVSALSISPLRSKGGMSLFALPDYTIQARLQLRQPVFQESAGTDLRRRKYDKQSKTYSR